MDVLHLKIKLPYLFEPVSMFIHFREPTGIDIKEHICFDIVSKGAQILKWMKIKPNDNERRIQQELLQAN